MMPGFSKSNTRLAALILDDPAAIVQASIKAFAVRAEVSEPTVIRFCREVGCEGYKELKIRLTQYLAVEQMFADRDEDSESTGRATGPFSSLYRSFTDAMQSVMTDAILDRINEASAAIIDAKKLYIYGVGGASAALAIEAQNRLFRLGVAAIPHADSYMQRMTAATVQEGDAVLAISATGQVRSLIEAVEAARYYGATAISITAENTPLDSVSDICIPVNLEQQVAYHQPSPVRYAQLFVLDCLADQVALTLGDKAKTPLKRISAMVTAVRGVVPRQPIGD